MSRRWWELAFALGSAGLAAITVWTVPLDWLGAWSAGTLGPLVVVGAVVCVLSWPPGAGGAEARTPWRGAYLVPLLVTAVVARPVVEEQPGGLSPTAAVVMFGFLAYVALLLGVAVFLVLLLPVARLLRSVSGRDRGDRDAASSIYGPGAAAVVLSITVFSTGGALALDGVPDTEVGLLWLVAGVAGLLLPGVTVASPGWLLVARLGGIGIVASGIAVAVAAKRVRRGAPEPSASSTQRLE